ncbi:conserved hypothetical protein [Neospora caninum Liverpool]|uniref:Transmembrane protein n=1 Tax=Neospora caninum (strain Liverpool) TaxID=572307 RepID=F0VDX8_NEOCL|nr:conserved hypothetical protein [Neospora caninum Liverpool]CBZ51921.1 conserved hypothetical protein [Neospora caninum Liverpool]CEL65883.1 TPA: hypothetical protein BN1204_017130 [Neospora caninum Liverpool]|eukprot:XP_003881954.1 conserved hypothetical protein [Neospora caninum Liverpool]
MAPLTPPSDPEAPGDEEPLLGKSRKKSTYRQCCWCPLGTAVTLWAVFLIAFSVFLVFDFNIRGAAFTSGAVLGLITATLLLCAAGQQNAFIAFVSFYLQIMVYVLWALQMGLAAVSLWKVTHRPASSPGSGYESAESPRVILSQYVVMADTVTGEDGSKPVQVYRQVEASFAVYEATFCAFYAMQLLLAHFVLSMLWSFYRVLQAGGTGFEKKTAEELEEDALSAQFPSFVEDTPRDSLPA